LQLLVVFGLLAVVNVCYAGLIAPAIAPAAIAIAPAKSMDNSYFT